MQYTTCDVHRILDNDSMPRHCEYCPRCRAWICKDDLHRWDRRAKAMIKQWGNPHGPAETISTHPVASGCGGCGKG